MEWTNDVSLEFLRLYEKERVIWNPKDKNHKNRHALYEAWTRILQALKSQGVDCTINDLKRKKESLMATFRSLFRKMNAKKSNNDSDDVNKPNWFAFEAMHRFLTDVYIPKPSVNSEGQAEVNFLLPLDEVSEVDVSQLSEENSAPIVNEIHEEDNNTSTTTFAYEIPVIKQPKKRKSVDPPELDDSMETTSRTRRKDVCTLYTELLAVKLRTLDEGTRELLMHDIDNLVFHARMKQFSPAPVTGNYVYVRPSPRPQNLRQNSYVQVTPRNLEQASESPGWSEYSRNSPAEETIAVIKQPQPSPSWSESSVELK